MLFINFRDAKSDGTVGVVVDDRIYDISGLCENDLLRVIQGGRINDPEFHEEVRGHISGSEPLSVTFTDLEGAEPGAERGLNMPYRPPEIWACGVTYKKQMELHEGDLSQNNGCSGIYNYVYSSERPEIFFKGLAHHCVGTNDYFTIRCDSNQTFIEAELACVYDRKGEIVAFTAVNDITAWDLERECPLFLNQAKIFKGGCVMGPGIVPASLIPDPMNLNVKCRVFRSGQLIYEGDGSTSRLKRSFEEFRTFLTRNNTISDGTVLCTGTTVGIPKEMFMEDSDLSEIEVEGIGMIRSTAKKLGYDD